MGPVGGALSPLHPPCSKAHSEFTSKTIIDVPWSFVQCHRARSSEIGLLEQTQFLPVFPTLYRVLGSEPCGLVILHVLFLNLSWEVFPGAHCSIEEAGGSCPDLVWAAKASDKHVLHIAFTGLCSLDPSLSESQPWGPIVHRALVPSGGWVPPHCLSHLVWQYTRDIFSSHTNYFNYIISDRSRRPLEETPGSITKIFSGTTIKSYICTFLSLLMNCTTL